MPPTLGWIRSIGPLGLGARQASLAAGIPQTTPTTTVGKVCGSGMQAIIFGA